MGFPPGFPGMAEKLSRPPGAIAQRDRTLRHHGNIMSDDWTIHGKLLGDPVT